VAGESLISREGGAGRGAAGGSAGVGAFGEEEDGGRAETSGLGEVRDEVAQPASIKTLSGGMRPLSERYFRTMI
jgi:hypothetical protein